MLQTMKWSFALLVVFASIAQAQSDEPKKQNDVTGNVWWGFPSWGTWYTTV